MGLAIERCADPGSGDAIKALFLRNDRPSFPGQFDAVYPASYANGGASWLARNDQGDVVGHVAVFPRTLRSRSVTVNAALFGDLMMDADHRDFFSAVGLVRRAVAELRGSGRFDVAHAHSIDLAHGVLRAAGLKPSGALRRYVTPVNRLYRAAMAWRSGARRLEARTVPSAWEDEVQAALDAIPPGALLRGDRSLDLYRPHLGQESLEDWRWIVLGERGGSSGPLALVLAARTDHGRTLAIRDLRWNEVRTTAESVLAALPAAARQAGCAKVALSTLDATGFAAALPRTGYIVREDVLPFLTLETGRAAVPPLQEWLVTFMDGSAW